MKKGNRGPVLCLDGKELQGPHAQHWYIHIWRRATESLHSALTAPYVQKACRNAFFCTDRTMYELWRAAGALCLTLIALCTENVLVLFSVYVHHHPHHLSCLHPCLSPSGCCLSCGSCSSFLIPQFLTGCLQSTTLRFPSGVQCIATSVMELASSCNMCLIQCHCCLVTMVSISSRWYHVERSWLEMVPG